MDGKRESKESMLSPWLDDDDDDSSSYLWVIWWQIDTQKTFIRQAVLMEISWNTWTVMIFI